MTPRPHRSRPVGARSLCGLLAVTLLLALAGCRGDATPARGDVLLITVDTLRADHLGIYGYARATSPRLDAFFADGLVIERAYSTEANTSPSVVSILSGLLPQQHRVRMLYQLVPEQTQLVVDLLPDDYQTAAFVSNIVLTDEAMGLADRFDHYDDRVSEAIGEPGSRHVLYEREARATTDAALRWLDAERDRSRPLFLWVHYIDPHGPYTPPADSPTSFEHDEPLHVDAGRLPQAIAKQGETNAMAYVDAYDQEIAHTDAQIGRLLDGYGATSPIDDALVLFTADHGESMLEHEVWFAHGYQVYDEIVRVPLLLRGPGVPGGRLDGIGSGIDVAPTILAFAGAEPVPGSAGVDLRGGVIAEDRVVFSEATSPLGLLMKAHERDAVGYWRTAVQGSQKWTVGMVRGNRATRERRYYDLDEDPEELSPEARDLQGEAGNALLELIESDPDPGGLPQEMKRGVQIGAPKVAPRATAEQRERLRALGYVE